MSARVTIYTDGGCRNNPGVGSWAFIVVVGDSVVYEESFYEMATTNNRMEMMAIIQALKWLRENLPESDATIYSDSMYCVNGYNSWVNKWIKNDWHKDKQKTKRVLNSDLWKELYTLKLEREAIVSHVKGHSGNIYNERADELCNDIMDTLL